MMAKEVFKQFNTEQYPNIPCSNQRYLLANVCKIAYQWLDNTFLPSHCL